MHQIVGILFQASFWHEKRWEKWRKKRMIVIVWIPCKKNPGIEIAQVQNLEVPERRGIVSALKLIVMC